MKCVYSRSVSGGPAGRPEAIGRVYGNSMNVTRRNDDCGGTGRERNVKIHARMRCSSASSSAVRWATLEMYIGPRARGLRDRFEAAKSAFKDVRNIAIASNRSSERAVRSPADRWSGAASRFRAAARSQVAPDARERLRDAASPIPFVRCTTPAKNDHSRLVTAASPGLWRAAGRGEIVRAVRRRVPRRRVASR